MLYFRLMKHWIGLLSLNVSYNKDFQLTLDDVNNMTAVKTVLQTLDLSYTAESGHAMYVFLSKKTK